MLSGYYGFMKLTPQARFHVGTVVCGVFYGKEIKRFCQKTREKEKTNMYPTKKKVFLTLGLVCVMVLLCSMTVLAAEDRVYTSTVYATFWALLPDRKSVV